MHKVLLIDDERVWSLNLKDELEQHGFAVAYEESAENTLNRIRSFKPDVVLLDLIFSHENKGKEQFDLARKMHPDVPIIILTSTMVDSYDDNEYPGRALAYPKDSLQPDDESTYKDFADTIRDVIERVDDIEKYRGQFDFEMGTTDRMKEVCRVILRAAKTKSNVFITGETGTGKELAARAIHRLSDRRKGPFIAINCGAFPPTLIESELFGICARAATSVAERAGLFEQAHKGTIFLDEIPEMPPEQQAKLLRVLQDHTIARVGSQKKCECRDKTHPDHTSSVLDIRVIAATNQNMDALIKEKKFRDDLYSRLSVIPIHLPSLRERKADIETLAKRFINEINAKQNKTILTTIRPGLKAMLEAHDWPKNIRGLYHEIERAIALTNTRILMEGDFAHLANSSAQQDQPILSATDVDQITRDMMAGNLKWANIMKEFGNNGMLRCEILKGFIDRWLNEKGARPTSKELGEFLGESRNNMAQKLKDCGYQLKRDWPSRKQK